MNNLNYEPSEYAMRNRKVIMLFLLDDLENQEDLS